MDEPLTLSDALKQIAEMQEEKLALEKKNERLENSRGVREIERLQHTNNAMRTELDKLLRVQDLEDELSELRKRLDAYENRDAFEADLQAMDERIGQATFKAFDVLCKLKSYSERAHVLTALATLLGLDPSNLDQKLE